MSDNIPSEIQGEIFKRLPIKSLIQLRSVSKAWKSLIDSSDFIAHYRGQVQHLLVSTLCAFGQDFVLVADNDDTFPQHKVDLTLPRLLNRIDHYSITGCSNGLLCLYGDYQEGRGGHNSLTGMVVLWNLSIRKAIGVIVPNVGVGIYATVVGFGVSCETADIKIVKITYIKASNIMESISCIPWQVEVFTLSTGAWRGLYSNLPRKSIKFDWEHIVVDGYLYWLATDRIAMDGICRSFNLIISFDMTTEEFKEVSLPDSLALAAHTDLILTISKLMNSLVVLARDLDANDRVFIVWKMEDSVPKSFTKLFTVNVNTTDPLICGFRKNGAPIVEIFELENYRALVVYEPYSKQINDIGSGTIDYTFFVYPYMETLLLIDQPDRMVYNDI